MISRRTLLARSAGLAAGLAAARVDAAPVLTDDGLYSEPWFLESFLILAEDLEAAAARGKRFAVMWELKGCPFCRDTHLVNFADPTVAGFIKDRFEILQLNIIGGREVVDFDGERLSEKGMAAKYRVRGTPTVQFFPDAGAGLESRAPAAARGVPDARLPAAEGLPDHVRLRRRQGLRARHAARLPQGSRIAAHYLFTGESLSISSATRSVICSGVSTLLAPKRGMFEQAKLACAS